jgi:hypothetical protein
MTQLMLFSVRLSNLPVSVVSHNASIVENLGLADCPLEIGRATYEVVRLSSLGLNTNSFDSPPTVDGWVSYNDLLSALNRIKVHELTIRNPGYRQWSIPTHPLEQQVVMDDAYFPDLIDYLPL